MVMRSMDRDVIIIGAGLAGLSCARSLASADIPFITLEADQRIGGRLKTDQFDGFLLDHGFQVLQTAYPEARSVLDFERLELGYFAPGAIIRSKEKFHRISDPRRRPREVWSTATAPIGNFRDRLRILNLALKIRRKSVSALFEEPDMPTIDFLQAERFSDQIIHKFFIPFFSGVTLDPEIRASSRVFKYIFRIFAEGNVALPAAGMAAIPNQIAESLPADRFRMSAGVESIHPGWVTLNSGEEIKGGAIILATEGPETARLLNRSSRIASRGEVCLYFSSEVPPMHDPYLILNGNGKGMVNSLTIPSIVTPTYAPDGQYLISVVVVGHPDFDDTTVEAIVRSELTEWFGAAVDEWRHLKTYRLNHALPVQQPPMPNPTISAALVEPGIFLCGEYGSVPGIQWAMLSGRYAAEAAATFLSEQ